MWAICDRDDRQDRVDERGYEDAEGDLAAEVTRAVPRRTRPELLGGESQGHNRDRAHDAGSGEPR